MLCVHVFLSLVVVHNRISGRWAYWRVRWPRAMPRILSCPKWPYVPPVHPHDTHDTDDQRHDTHDTHDTRPTTRHTRHDTLLSLTTRPTTRVVAQALQRIFSEGIPPLKDPDRWSAAFQHFQELCFYREPEKRPSANELLRVRFSSPPSAPFPFCVVCRVVCCRLTGLPDATIHTHTHTQHSIRCSTTWRRSRSRWWT
jgi:hypothetical protein